jgi:hypothetical protein
MQLSAISQRAKMGIVLAGYACVLVVSAMWITTRYLAEQQDPAMFNSGMAAGGDWFLELIIVGMLLVPTFLLALIIRDSETASTKFAKILLAFALALPVSTALMVIPAVGQSKNTVWSVIGYVCLYRVFAFPMTLFGFIGCCVLAKFKRPRRLILYSIGIEIASTVLLFTMGSIK